MEEKAYIYHYKNKFQFVVANSNRQRRNKGQNMNKAFVSKSIPHIVAVIIFLCISFFYFPAMFEGKVLIAHDTQSWGNMAKETLDYNSTHDDVTLWTNSMFGGMPTYQISTEQPYNFIQIIEKALTQIPRPAFFLFLYLLCFYICALTFRLNPWLSIVASIAFTFASYNFIIIAAGHNSKAITIAYMAPLIGSIFMAFRGKRFLGALLTALFLSLTIRANHIQILYYTLFIVIFFAIAELVFSIKDKKLADFFKTSTVLLIAAIVAIGMNATALITTYEYSQYTMRGKSNGLTSDTQNSQHGLNKDYITQWSYGIDETLTILIPNYKGGASGIKLSADSETGKKIQSFGVSNVDKIMDGMQLPLYWGTQPFTSGPVYFGAIVCLLFVLGLFIVDKRVLWWVVPMIILTLMLSWGRNFMWLTDIFIDYVPMYNKFRTVSMTLVATGFGVALIAILALKKIFDPATDKQKLIRPLTISTAIVGGIALIFALIPSIAGDFTAASDAQQFQGDYAFLQETLPLDREAMLRSDAWRSLAFILLTAALVFVYIKNYLKEKVVYLLFGLLMLIDLMPVTKRYLNNDNFENPRKHQQTTLPSKADLMVLEDKSYYRVLDMSVNIFNDASPANFHKNIGGYHAAKLRRYQELINMQIDGEIRELASSFQSNNIEETLQNLGVLNMLNMKYVIYKKEFAPLVNPYANGNAWFVHNIRIAENADEEMALTGEIDTKNELVIDKIFKDQLIPVTNPDSAASITLLEYQPNKLRYQVSSATEQTAVFSEIYYDKGWNAYIDGAKVPYVRANYLLRAMPLKAGSYELEFRFEPQSYKIGNIIALTSSIIFILAFIVAGFFYWRKQKGSK